MSRLAAKLGGSEGTDAALEAWHTVLTWAMLASALPTFVSLMSGISAPYGRYSRGGWGIMVNARLAWFTQEVPSLLLFVAFLLLTKPGLPPLASADPWLAPRSVLAVAFTCHYIYRSILFPCIIRGGKPTPLSVWAMSFVFCIWNGFLQGWSVGRQLSPDATWSPRVVAGLAVWLFGWLNVMRADLILIDLRKPGETGYKIPRGGMFEFVSAGNYASEIIEWTGFAIACGTPAAAAFALFTFCNLAPRAHHHHQWYLDKFRDEYPSSRRAVLPFLW